MTVRICTVCEEAVDYRKRWVVVEEWIGSKSVKRRAGHWYCVMGVEDD